MPSIIVFPGQGSQFVGMGKKLLHLPKVERMFEIASGIFKFDLMSLCLNGPKSELDKTNVSQVAVFVTSMGAVEHLKETNPKAIEECYATAGFSIGEYAALVLSNALKFEDALRLIKVRSDSMQKASESVPSGMMSVFLSKDSKLNMALLGARKWCTEQLKMPDPIECKIANYLYHGCKVIGGNKEALDFIEHNYKEFNIKRIKRLAVSGAFHTGLMRPAEFDLKDQLDHIVIQRPLIKFYSNYTANPCSHPNKIKLNLVKQVSAPVRWEQTLNNLYYNENLPVHEQDDHQPQPDSEQPARTVNVQTDDRVYPDIYECGPAAQTGPILREINYKAYRFYKHIGV